MTPAAHFRPAVSLRAESAIALIIIGPNRGPEI